MSRRRSPLRSVRLLALLEVCLALLLFSGAAASQSFRVEGSVRDSSGAAVAGAEIGLRAGSTTLSRTTDSSGSFVFDSLAESRGTVSVRAKGFGVVEKSWNAEAGEQPISKLCWRRLRPVSRSWSPPLASKPD